MSAERLREAATLMRERAEAARPGPWWIHDDNDCDIWWGDQAAVRAVDQDTRALRPLMSDAEIEATWDHAGCVIGSDVDRAEDAAHIASWHPVVALAVADLLDAVALVADHYPPLEIRPDSVASKALAVADAYLGSTS